MGDSQRRLYAPDGPVQSRPCVRYQSLQPARLRVEGNQQLRDHSVLVAPDYLQIHNHHHHPHHQRKKEAAPNYSTLPPTLSPTSRAARPFSAQASACAASLVRSTNTNLSHKLFPRVITQMSLTSLLKKPSSAPSTTEARPSTPSRPSPTMPARKTRAASPCSQSPARSPASSSRSSATTRHWRRST